MKEQIKKLDFNGHDIFIGIDVHKNSWVVTIMLKGLVHKTFSMNPEAKQLMSYLQTHFPGGNYYSAYEAGFCGFSVHRKLSTLGIDNIVVNPADIPVTDKEKRQKEDKRDSRKIARGLSNGELNAIYVPTIETEEIRLLLKCRTDIVKDLNRIKNRIKSVLFLQGISIPKHLQSSSIHFSAPYVKWLKTLSFSSASGKFSFDTMISLAEQQRLTLLSVTREVRKKAKQGKLSNTVNLLCSMPGVGIITAMTIIAEIEDINRFSRNDDLCSFIGLVPSMSTSGDNDKTGPITSRCNKKLRGLIVESAWIASRKDPALILAYQELCTRMKPSKAIIRIAKKLINRMRYILKNEEPYKYALVA
jgi:transposase